MTTQMQASPRLITLIHDATMRAGNESRLAREVEENRHNVNAWKQGKRACPIEAQVLMAAIAGRDVDEVIRDALIERNANTPRGEKLVSALGKGLMAIGGAILFWAPGNDALAFNLPGVLRCILC